MLIMELKTNCHANIKIEESNGLLSLYVQVDSGSGTYWQTVKVLPTSASALKELINDFADQVKNTSEFYNLGVCL